MDERDHVDGGNQRGAGGRISRSGHRAAGATALLRGAAGLTARSAAPLLRTLLAGAALLVAFALPAWIWLQVAARLVDLGGLVDPTTGDLVRVIGVMVLPVLALVGLVVLATIGGAAIVLDDVAAGRRPRAVRSVGRGLRSAPRLLVTFGLAALTVALLVAAGPAIVLVGVLAAAVTAVGRRLRPATRWPSRRTLVALVVPFAPAALCAARWSLLPSVVVVERTTGRAAFRRARALSDGRRVDLAILLALLVLAAVAVVRAAGALLDSATDASTASDLLLMGVEGAVLLIVVAIASVVFVDGGGRAATPPAPPSKLLPVATIVVIALVAGVVPGLIVAPPARAAAPGSTLVVDDLGDGDDAVPGDGACATAADACTLRAALAEANTTTDASIGFDVSGTIVLGSGLTLARPVTIDGTGQSVVVSGDGTSSVFSIQMEVPGGGYGAIRNLTIADGYEGATGGAAVYNSGTSAGFLLEGVTVRDNTVAPGAMFGGAVVNLSVLTIRNSTFVGNDADVAIEGSDLANRFSGSATIEHSTFVGGTGFSSIASDGSSLTIANSIISAPGNACTGTMSGIGNVSTDATPVCPGSSTTTAALALAPLADNGGDTPTARLTQASSAIDAGSPTACTPLDQRGTSRPLGSGCDAGAYELDPATTTTLSSGPNPSSAGALVTLTATVAATGEPETPAGTVELFDGAASLGTTPVGAGGVATLSTTTLAVGTRSLTATYHPSGHFAASTSPVRTHVVDSASTTVLLTSSGGPTLGGQPVTFFADVVGSGAPATGSVTFVDGATPLATVALDGAGHAEHATTTLAGGNHQIIATYGGDASHLGATSAPLSHDVVVASTVTLTGPAGPTVYGTDATFAVVVAPTGGGATPSGSVTVRSGSVDLGTAPLVAGGATVVVTTLLPGAHTLTASYSGDSFNGPATSPPVTHTVVDAPTATSLSVSPAGSVVFGNAVLLQATVTTGSPSHPVGTVRFLDGTTEVGLASVDGVGLASVLVPALPAGSYLLRADYLPGAGFAGSTSAPSPFTVAPATTATSMTASSPASVFGQSVTLEAVVATAGSPRTANGTVTFRDGSAVLGVAPLDGSGRATLDTGAIAVGSRTLTATFNGAADFTGSTSPGLGHLVTAASVSVQIDDASDPTVFGATVTLDLRVVAVAPGQGVPGGSVTVREGSTTLATTTLDGSGRARVDVPGLGVGTHTLTAAYAGDGRFALGSAAIDHTVVADVATVELVSSAPSSTFGQPVTFTATVTGTGPSTPTGTVTFQRGSVDLQTVALDGAGVARLVVADLPYGTYLVSATYHGDAGFGPASDAVAQTVAAAATATNLTVDRPTPTVDDLVTLTATVTGPTSAAPTGTVTFLDGSTVLAAVPVGSDGRATYAQRFSRSVHTLTARFAGTPGWATSTSSPIGITPSRATAALVLAGSPATVAVGSATTWTATLERPPGGPEPAGSVGFFAGSTLIGVAPVIGGTATLVLPAPAAVGPWTVAAAYEGDPSHEPSTSSASSVLVVGAATTVTPVVPAAVYATDAVVVRANVTSGFTGLPLAGTVRFASDAPGATPISASVDATGWAEAPLAGLPAGDWTVAATYLPASGAVFAGSSASAPVQVQRRGAGVTLTVPDAITAGRPFTVEVAVRDQTGTGPSPTGSVTITGGRASCTTTVAAGRCSLTIGEVGPTALSAAYTGDAAYAAATSAPALVAVDGGSAVLTAWSPTATWATGDPVLIVWRVAGPTGGQVSVRTPTGEVCRSSVLLLGSCTVTFPFAQRGATMPVDVVYEGTDGWPPQQTTITGDIVGCYPLILEAIPAGAGSVTGPSGNCNGGTGFLDGTPVSVQVEPVAPYVLDHWLEDGSTRRTSSFVVGEGSRSATALLVVDCKEVSFTSGEQIDLGTRRSIGGRVQVTPPNCPGRPEVRTDGATGVSTAWYLPDTQVTFTGAPFRPQSDELKGWLVDDVLDRTTAPLTVTARDDLRVEARFGVQCVRPTFTSLGGGAARITTPMDCLDASGFGWQQGSEVQARVLPDAYHWIASYGTNLPVAEQRVPYRWPDTQVDVEEGLGRWTAVDDLVVQVSFETCRRLGVDPHGPGSVEVVSAPNCRTRLAYEGLWFDPGTRVEVRAVPDPPSTRPSSRRDQDGNVQPMRETVEPEFLRWGDLDQEGKLDRDTGLLDPLVGYVTIVEDRVVSAEFFDGGRCMPFVQQVQPPGAASLDVTLTDGQHECPDGQADLADPEVATFEADPVAPAPAVGWQVTTTDPDSEQTRHLRLKNDGEPVTVMNQTSATAYVCVVIQPEITLVAPDGTEVSGPSPAGSDFVVADTAPDCPLWENAFLVGTQLTIVAAAPMVGYDFVRWEGDIGGDALETKVTLDGAKPTIVAHAVYQVRCTTVTLQPAAKLPEVSPKPNCPGQPPSGLAANQSRYIGGTPLMLDAKAWKDHDFVNWTGEGLLERDAMVDAFSQSGLDDLAALAQAMDHPAMVTADFDMTVTANYTEHTVWEKIGDDLAVLGKKTVGVLSYLAIGMYESVALGMVRAAVGLAGLLAKAIDPGNTSVADFFTRTQALFDLTELTFLCAAEWAKGTQPKNPATVDAFDNNELVPDIDPEDVITSTTGLARKGLSLHDALIDYRRAHASQYQADAYLKKIPLTKRTISGQTITTAKFAWKALGTAAAIGTAIYSFVADGPGIVWEDTAEQAWETGPGPFEDCVVRRLHAALPEVIPDPSA